MVKIDLPIDHVAFSVKDRHAVENLLSRLGFVFGSTSRDAFIHTVFDRGYLEWVPEAYDGKTAFDTDAPSVKIRAYHIASGNIADTFSALKENGYKVDAPGKFSRYAKHGINQGMAEFGYCILAENDIFSSGVSLGCVQQMTPEYIYEGRYRHVNDAASIKSLIFCAKEYETALLALKKLGGCMKASKDIAHGIPEIWLISEKEYETAFGIPFAGKKTELAAVCFAQADKKYMESQCEDLNIHWSAGENWFCADVRETLGTLFVSGDRHFLKIPRPQCNTCPFF